MTYPEPTRSPRRQKIMKMVKAGPLSAAQIGERLGVSRESAYNVLIKMDAANQVRKFINDGGVTWGEYVIPPPVYREPRVHAGTMREPLSLAYMNNVHRPGAMDAFAIESRGIKA